ARVNSSVLLMLLEQRDIAGPERVTEIDRQLIEGVLALAQNPAANFEIRPDERTAIKRGETTRFLRARFKRVLELVF
ncbi:hypothetical protein KJ742_04305, partial [Patescibacteria group bacterium]|nr:hypothetical protein [Patescibacteria group bacterium]